MTPNPSTGAMQSGSMVEPAEPSAIMNNFNKGLTQVRSTLIPLPPPFVVRKPIRAPELALLPPAVTPRKGLFLSSLFHAAVAVTVIFIPILYPAWLMIEPSDSEDVDRKAEYQPLFLPILPSLAGASEGAKREHRAGEKVHSTAETWPTVARSAANPPKPDYAGPQLIVSNPPNSRAGVQTIRRPDLVAPPKMNYPLRLPSVVVLPHRAIRAPVAPRLEQPVLSNPDALVTFRPSEPPAPVVPKDKPKLSLATTKPVVPKSTATSEPSAPVFAGSMDPDMSTQKAVVIINAVSVPREPAPMVPEAELASRFVVGPSRAGTTVAGATPGAAGGSVVATGTVKPGENSPQASVENGSAARTETRDGHSGLGSSESSPGAGPRPGSSSGSTTPATVGSKGLPGISISGGTPANSGRAGTINPTPHGSYGLTIISSGSNGGASRDLGVFSRSDAVYTVYIPMTDVGGGPEWSLQYALTSPVQARNGLPNSLLTPPVVLKKSQALAPKTILTVNSGPVFVTGIIDENGKLAALRAIRSVDVRTQSAVTALSQWEFLAAKLDGKPVACKVLIGVSVLPDKDAER